MQRFLAKRAIASLVSLAFLVVAVFFLSRLTGDPTDLYLPVDASIEARDQFRQIHGLNDPLIVQFGRYLGDLAMLDFGESIRRARPALEVVLEAFQWTLALALMTMALVTAAAITIGSLAAFHVGGIFDRIATFFSLIGASAPDFWIAIVAIVFFSVYLGWLPTSGTGSPLHWVLPIAVLFIRPFGLILQVVRGSMITALGSAYVKTARAKGVGQTGILFLHALKNAAVPIVTVIGLGIALLIGGAVITESVFAIPGLGRLTVDAILRRDYPIIQGVVLLFSFTYVLVNLCIDLLYTLFDPRIRY